jgi:spore germination protein GerM
MSLIPKGTKLLGVTVKDGVALLNFSEDFEYNTYGVEGYLGQLMQIVYTATSFSTVSSVQFLLEGQKKEYLGSEGVWIGSPLARSTFR